MALRLKVEVEVTSWRTMREIWAPCRNNGYSPVTFGYENRRLRKAGPGFMG